MTTYGEAEINDVTPDNFWQQDEEFRDLLLNIIKIHVVSEEVGADSFEASILRAPDPVFKMRMAKTVMEEYGHHLRFKQLLDELDLDWEELTKDKDALSTFDVPIETWADQVVFLALIDRAAAHQFRHFVKSPYAPFRKACQDTLNEEYGHVGLGMDGVKDLLKTPEGRAEVEAVLAKWLKVGLASFGSNNSKTNERYRHWGIKADTNENMRDAYYEQVQGFITRDWGIDIPEKPNDFMDMIPKSDKEAPVFAG